MQEEAAVKKRKVIKTDNPDRILSYFRQEKMVLIIITITGIIYNVGMAAGPYFEGQLAQYLYDIINGQKNISDMVKIAVMYVVVIFCIQSARGFKRYYVRIFANDISRSMRHILYNSLVHMNDKELDQEKLGSLMTKAIADVDACVEGMRKFTTEVFDTGVVMLVYLVMLAALDWKLTLCAIIFTPAAYMIANGLKRQVSAANFAYKESAAGLNQMTMDRVVNAITYRQFGREDNRNEAYEERLSDYEKRSARANIFEGSLTPIYDAISMIGVIIILYVGSKNVVGSGWTTWNIASFTTFLACFTKLAKKTSHAAKLFNAIQKAQVSWKRIKPLMKPITEQKCVMKQIEPVSLKFDDVTCGYNEETTLKHISFTAVPGEIIGVTGVVASGKSMLGKVLLDQVPENGSIRIGKKEFVKLSDSEKHNYISYMGHEPELMSISVCENIALGDDVNVDKWLKVVCLDEEIAAMKDGKDTLIGASGTQLSGGQQARLALARTLAHARSILILDDPLAAVDKNTETKILQNIKAEMSDRVILLISHRLYHFSQMDHVLFIHDGTADYAAHEDLMKEQSLYYHLYQKQMTGGDLDE